MLRWARWHPVTASLLSLLVLAFLLQFFRLRVLRIEELAFVPPLALSLPWTAVTWPFAGMPDPFSLLFECWWLWLVGSELESRRGPLRLAVLVVASALASAIGYWIWWRLLGGTFPAPLGGFSVPLAAMTVAWCLANPGRVVLFSFLVPVSGKTLLWLSLALLYFGIGLGLGPLAALFVSVGASVAWPWSAWGTGGNRGSGARGDRLSLADRFRLWRARRRMRKVWDADDPDRFVN